MKKALGYGTVGLLFCAIMLNGPAVTADPISGVRGVANQDVIAGIGTTIGFNSICPVEYPLPISASAYWWTPGIGSVYDTQKVLVAEISPNGSNNAVGVYLPPRAMSVRVHVIVFCAAV